LKQPFIVALIPAYNEEKNIAAILLETEKYVDKIVVCDDGSTDRTAQIAERLGAEVIRHSTNKGYGAAIISLLKRALDMGADIAVTLDADGQHDPRFIPNLVKPILRNEADIVIGSRFLEKSEIPKYRKIGIKAITKLTNLATKLRITDSQSGYRAYSKRALQEIAPELSEHGMGISLQILTLVSEKKLSVKEVPITIKYDVEKPSTKNPITHGVELISTIIREITERHPLVYFGIPGATLLFIGLFMGAYLLWIFNTNRYFSMPIAIITLGALLMGLLLTITALIIHVVIRQLK